MRKYVTIVGAGAIGTIIASHIASVRPVTILCRTSTCVSEIKERGLVTRILDKDVIEVKTVDVITSNECYSRSIDDCGFVIIATKAYSLGSALRAINNCCRRMTMILSTQNGLGSLETIEYLYGAENSAAMIISYGAIREGYGKAVLTGQGEIILGQREGLKNPSLGEFYDLLKDSGLEAKLINSDIEPYRWLKLAINAAINPLTTILNAPNRIIIDDIDARNIAFKIVKEVELVARKKNIVFPQDPVTKLVEVARATGENLSSMLQDVINKRKTEIDFINGAVVVLGKKYHIETPYNKLLWKLVKVLEKWRLRI